MAKVGNNILTHGLSGMVGDLIVFRQRDGKTIVSSKPEHHGPMSEAQLQHIQKFQEAVIYAKSVLGDPEKRDAYKHAAKQGQSAYNVALADFLKAPHIEEIDVSGYNGQPGSRIRVRAVDDFKVAEVSVVIQDADGKELEWINHFKLWFLCQRYNLKAIRASIIFMNLKIVLYLIFDFIK